MATLSTTQTGASPEYLRYSYGSITKTDRASDPTLLDFRVIPSDNAFVKLTRGAYITLNTKKYGVWFTGFVTNDAELEFLGSKTVGGVATPVYGYIYQATSDQYLLNLKPIGIVPPFVNTTQGAIIRYLVNLLTPAGWEFDVSGVMDGQGITRYVVDPVKKFTEVVKEFSDAANFQFRIVNKVITYVQQDSADCGIVIDGLDKHFTPSRLTLKPVPDPVINDSIIIGGIEPQTFFNEYFVGDGVTPHFPLVNGVYGVDSTILLDDNFSSSTIDNTKWTLVDSANSHLQPLNGFLNVLGGNNTGAFDVYLQAQSLIPLEGNLRLTHGEYDFTQGSDGIIASLWTQDCSADLTQCLYGLRSTISGLNTVLHPIVNGAVDTTQSFTVNYLRRYNIRTLFGCTQAKRLTPQRSYRSQDGSVGRYGGTSKPAVAYFQTIITEIDPTTGLVTQSATFLTSDVTLTQEQNYGYYCPVVSNNLHLTVTGVTISTPMQTNLEMQLAGTSVFLPQLMGPNEINSYDGLSPKATIVDANSGATVRSTVLGSPTYNSGQATLTYFKDTLAQVSQTPQVGSLIHLRYRVPGAAIGRVQNRLSLASESLAFHDDGVRTAVIHDLSPLPSTAEECEQGAAAYIAMYGYQHYEGSYNMPSGYWFSSEPRSGTVLRFANTDKLPGFPPYLQAEAVTEVVTTLVGNLGANNTPVVGYGASPYGADQWGDNSMDANTELFNHAITFGPINKLTQFLGTLSSNKDVFVIQDTAEIPNFVDISSVGASHAIDVTSPLLTGWDRDFYYYTTGVTPPTGTYFEVRYSDSGWGSTSTANLVTRVTSGNTFSVPRNARGRVVYIRAYDTRNVFAWSNDLTRMAVQIPSSASYPFIQVKGKLPDNSIGFVTEYRTTSPFADIYSGQIAPSFSGCWTIDVLGAAGTTALFGVYAFPSDVFANDVQVTCNGGWQRVSMPFTWPSIATGEVVYRISSSATIQLCNSSVEQGVAAETVFCKTSGSAYGALSRYSAGIRVQYPAIPPAPSATYNYNDAANPIVNIVLPAVLQDVWGIEVRAADNTTVLYHSDLITSGYYPTYTVANNSSRSLSLWLYCYNLLGEYSDGHNAVLTIPLPNILSIAVNDNKFVYWTASEDSTSFLVEIDTVDDTFARDYVNQIVTGTVWPLSDENFFNTAWIRVTPSDALGVGTPSIILRHQYTPDAVAEFDDNEVATVQPPATPGSPAPVNAAIVGWGPVYQTASLQNYGVNNVP